MTHKPSPEAWESNRDVRRRPKRMNHNAYCGGCDANHVAQGMKCEVCGYIEGGKRRLKKD